MTWLSGYSERVRIPINYSADGELTSFQVRIAIVKGSGSDSAGTIYLNNVALNWPYDIRFTSSDGQTLIDFWRQESDSTDGTWIIEVPVIAASGTTDIYLYYGKSGDTDASSGANAMRFCADFRNGVLPSNMIVSGRPQLEWNLSSSLSQASSTTVSADANKYEGWPTIAKLANGTLIAAYRTCDENVHDYSSSGRVVIRKSTDGGDSWGSEITVSNVSNDDDRNCGIVVFMNGATETVLVTYNSYLSLGGDAYFYCRKSTDGGDTWGAAIQINSTNKRFGYGNPICLSNGVLLAVAYTVTTNWKVYIYRSTDGGDTWGSEITAIDDATHQVDEASIIELKTSGSYSGKVLVIARSEQSPYSYYQNTSTDYGASWGTAAICPIPAPSYANPLGLTRLASGKLIATFSTSSNIVMYGSDDEAVSWISYGTLRSPGVSNAKHYARAVEVSAGVVGVVWCTNDTSASDIYYNEYTIPTTTTGLKITCPIYSPVETGFLYGTSNMARPAVMEWYCQDADYGTSDYPFPAGLGHYHGTTYDTNGVRREIYAAAKYCLMSNDGSSRQYTTGVANDWNAHTWKILWYSGGAKLYYESTLHGTNTSNIPSADIPVVLGRTYFAAGSDGCITNVQWAAVRKYTANEPTWATPGGKEHVSLYPVRNRTMKALIVR